MSKFQCFFVLSLCMLTYGVSMDCYANSNKHIRVILDTSASMRGYTDSQGNIHPPQDPGKISVLSVALLLDLAIKDLHITNVSDNSDSFQLIPFDSAYKEWIVDNSSPPSLAQSIKYLARQRSTFISKLNMLERNGIWTYFYPSLNRATVELTGDKYGFDDVKTIILITDGTSDKEMADKIKLEELVEKMAAANIRVYVLMFGKGASNLQFFKTIEKSSSGIKVATLKQVHTTDDLLKVMLDIFADRFGYQVDPLYDANSTKQLDLAQNSSHEQVAVVSLAYQPNIPLFGLTAVKKNTLNEVPTVNNHSLGEDDKTGGAYSLHWISKPALGKHGFKLKKVMSNVKIAVLRPVEYLIQDDLYETPSSLVSIHSVMADSKSQMFLKIETSVGGVPGTDTKIKYKVYSKDLGAEWNKDNEQKVNSMRTFPGFYQVEMVFEEHPNRDRRNEEYHATIEAEAFKNNISVNRGKKKELSVTVYPYLKLKAWDKTIPISGELKKSDTRCVSFKIKKIAGYWYKKNEPGIRVSLAVSSNSSNVQKNEFNQATFTLNGQRVFFDQTTDIKISYKDDFIFTENNNKNHKFCINMGKPINVNKDSKVDLVLQFSLAQEPYNRYTSVINPVTIKITVAEAHLIKWLFWLFWLPFLLLWYLRYIPKIETDLYYRFFLKGANESKLQEFGVGSFLRTLFRLTQKHDIRTPDNKHIIGYLIPTYEELYLIKCEGSFSLIDKLSSGLVHEKTGILIHVNKNYCITDGKQEFFFRIEYA